MRKIAATIFFSILLTLFSIAYVAPVHAQTPSGACAPQPGLTTEEAIDKINKCAIEKDIFDDKIFNLNQLAGTTDSIYNLLTGKSQLHPETDEVTAGTGALAATGKLVATLYSVPPVSGVNYFASQIQKFNPVQPAYAQAPVEGIGFGLLEPVQKIWTAFRNVSYVGFVIIFVIMGFMIMFRAHISPQAVATVQDSIPRIVVALILVTFSYAIAGLMLDLMFLLLNILIRILEPAGLDVTKANVVFEKSIIGVTFGSWKDIVSSVADAIANLIDQIITIPVFDKIIGFFGSGIAGIIVGIAVLFVMFRVFLMLLMAYVMILILTMAAPFFFLVQALPGNNGAKEWFKQIAANVSVFPVVALMIIFAGMLGGFESLGGSGATQLPAEKIGQFPLLSGGIKADAIGKLIALGFLLMTPTAAQMIKEMIGAKGPQLGPAVAGTLTGAGRVAAFPVTSAISRYNERRQARAFASAFTPTEEYEKQPGEGGGEPAIGRRH